jgi:hypothetical protein
MNRGLEWRRWEPHVHAPGTVMNNQQFVIKSSGRIVDANPEELLQKISMDTATPTSLDCSIVDAGDPPQASL